jgi:hypothetical protein
LEPPPPPPFLDTPDAEQPPEKKSRSAALPLRKLASWSLAGLIALSVVGFLIWKPPTTIMKQSECPARRTRRQGHQQLLSSVDADRARNVQLLKEQAWFDIPVVRNVVGDLASGKGQNLDECRVGLDDTTRRVNIAIARRPVRSVTAPRPRHRGCARS